MVMSSSRVPIPRGPSVQRALMQAPSVSTPLRVAVKASMLSMQEATQAASISPGEGCSPRPPMAAGTSVANVSPEGEKMLWQRMPPVSMDDDVYDVLVIDAGCGLRQHPYSSSLMGAEQSKNLTFMSHLVLDKRMDLCFIRLTFFTHIP